MLSQKFARRESVAPDSAAERRQSVAPGASPGFSFDTISAPEGRKSLSESFAPSGLRSRTTPTPGLRPGLHSVAAPRLNTAQVLARAHSGSFLDRNHNLDRSAVARRECAFHHCNTTFRCSCLRGGHQRGYVRSVLRLTRHGLRSSDVKSGTLDGGLR